MQLHLGDAAFLQGADGARRPLAPLDAALLAWLAIEGPTARARMAALLWPLKDAAAARSSLRQRLFQLRRQTGAELVTGEDPLALADSVVHDLHDSDGVLGALVPEAIAAGEFAQWLALQRERRRARVRSSLAELSEMAERSRDWDDALDHARELLALEPLSEEAHRRLMRLHHLRGDRAAALLAFDGCERMLKDEVGTRPSPETLELLAAIEASAAAGVPAARSAGLPAAVLRPPRLVGRDAEWRALESAWAAARVAWLLGEGGLGKSRLLADFMAGRAGARGLVVGARPGDVQLPHALLCRLLRAVLATGPLALPPGIRAELACLLPELGPSARSVDGTRLALALDTVLGAAARGGLEAIAIDDLHWADRASLDALSHAFAVGGLRWLVAQRPAEGAAGLGDLRRQFAAAHRADVVALLPLGEADVAELLESLCVPELATAATAAALNRRCGGNPLLLLECMKSDWAARHDGRALRLGGRIAGGLIEGRLARLSQDALRLARCAAVAGQDFHAALAQHVLKRDALDLADAWGELEAAHVLRDGAFAHDLVYEAALASVPAAIAAELHAEVAAFLETRDAEPARVASHWLAAGQQRRALPHLRSAARSAARQWRNAEAAAWLDEACRIAELAGQSEDAIRDHVAACEVRSRIAPVGTADAQRARALARNERSGVWALLVECAAAAEAGDIAGAAALAAAAAPLAHRHGMVEAEAEAHWNSAVACWDRGELTHALEHLERSQALWRRVDPAAAVLDVRNRLQNIASARGLGASQLGRFDEAHRLLHDAFEIAMADSALAQGAGASRELLHNAAQRGCRDEARHWDGVIERAEHEHASGLFERAMSERARAEWATADGRWADALRHFEAMESAMAAAPHRYAARLHAARALFDLDLGRRDLALQRLRALRAAGSLAAADGLVVDLALVCSGQRADPHALLDRLATQPDLSLRLRLLPRLAPHCEPDAVLPTLALAARAARDGGGLGLWAPLQAARAALLARAGRSSEAADSAVAAWREVSAGIVPMGPFPRFAADLAAALATSDAELAAEIAARGSAALRQACLGLPEAWRTACVERSAVARRLAMGVRGQSFGSHPPALPG